jgi:hypothetical protein
VCNTIKAILLLLQKLKEPIGMGSADAGEAFGKSYYDY